MIDLIKIYFRNIKNKFPQIIILASVFLFALLVLLIYNFYKKTFNSSVINALNNRELVVINENLDKKNEDSLKEIKKIDGVFDCNIRYYSISLFEAKEEYMFQFDYLIKEEIIIKSGKNIDELLNGEIILPSNLVSEYSIDDKINFYSKDKEKEYSFTVAGFYIDELGNNKIYISKEYLLKLSNELDIELPDNKYTVIVDDYDNLENVILKLEERGYSANLYDRSGIDKINSYMKVFTTLKIMIAILLVISVFILSILLNNIISTENKDISIMKLSGYKKHQILSTIFFRILVLILIVLGFIFIFYNFIYIIVLLLNFNNSFCNFFVNNYLSSLLSLILIFGIYVIVSFISCIIFSYKINRVSLIDLFKE